MHAWEVSIMFSKEFEVYQSALGQHGGLRPKPLVIGKRDLCTIVNRSEVDVMMITFGNATHDFVLNISKILQANIQTCLDREE
ncbi:jg8258 [Pararge aegeria aegeria]|uniref:Jg8258 protein n=1 Tax=Pararge aegeria aegeria TaxID=348720 RepID=A0A8S4RNS0_9NEOP|nr:jg8258 [Pararge aegeria aegeria]